MVAALLAYEHSLVKPNDLSKMNAAFFTVNGYISLLFLLFWGAAVVVTRPVMEAEERFFGPKCGPPFDFTQGRQNDGSLRQD